MRQPIILSLKGGLIVSCQATEEEEFYGEGLMKRFAIAAERSGAVGIRANTPQDIRDIREHVKLPIIGLWKREYSDSEVYITPTITEVRAVIAAGADIVALDGTLRNRPQGETLADVVNEIKTNSSALVMADISTVEEGIAAEQLGCDLLSTTLSGYTSYSPQQKDPDFQLVTELSKRVKIPVLAEGRIQSPEQALHCLQQGAYAVVVGGAITRPHQIAKRYVDMIATAR
ncbi:N-acetylmannosamine-6-phosphate 2-epimerase [Paenibacillus chungangensis]|uniref:Putative N-acetylmannosamine-6-phosphate 2-epimerase n=1 Tax=Paenibacillus chungangensis TaxID=696535 RepID=A0ABW3HKL7_9BACL